MYGLNSKRIVISYMVWPYDLTQSRRQKIRLLVWFWWNRFKLHFLLTQHREGNALTWRTAGRAMLKLPRLTCHECCATENHVITRLELEVKGLRRIRLLRVQTRSHGLDCASCPAIFCTTWFDFSHLQRFEDGKWETTACIYFLFNFEKDRVHMLFVA